MQVMQSLRARWALFCLLTPMAPVGFGCLHVDSWFVALWATAATLVLLQMEWRLIRQCSAQSGAGPAVSLVCFFTAMVFAGSFVIYGQADAIADYAMGVVKPRPICAVVVYVQRPKGFDPWGCKMPGPVPPPPARSGAKIDSRAVVEATSRKLKRDSDPWP